MSIDANLTPYDAFEYLDSPGHWVAARLEAFRTARKGERVTRYKWRSIRGYAIQPGRSWGSIAEAVAAAQSRPAIWRQVHPCGIEIEA